MTTENAAEGYKRADDSGKLQSVHITKGIEKPLNRKIDSAIRILRLAEKQAEVYDEPVEIEGEGVLRF